MIFSIDDCINNQPDYMKAKWIKSINIFTNKMSQQEVLDAANVAHKNANGYEGRFKYFCSVCWNKIKELQEYA